MVDHFRRTRGDEIDPSVELVARKPTFAAAAEAAVYSRHPQYKKHDHQFRISGISMRHTWQRLRRRLSELRRATTFSEVHAIVKECAVAGFGELSIYDAAHRIGAWLGVEPDAVYLHRGTRDGAKALGLDAAAGLLAMRQLPRPLRRLTPEQVEDFLCIFKVRLRRMSR
jgi:hypothetical protein